MNRDSLKRELTEQFQQSLKQAMEAVEKAPDGQWIAASEWQIREIFQKLMAESFQKILQAKLDAADQAAFSPGGQVDPGGEAGGWPQPCLCGSGRGDDSGGNAAGEGQASPEPYHASPATGQSERGQYQAAGAAQGRKR